MFQKVNDDPSYNQFIDIIKMVADKYADDYDFMIEFENDFLSLQEFIPYTPEYMDYCAELSSRIIDKAYTNPKPLFVELGNIEYNMDVNNIQPKVFVLLGAFKILMEELKENGYTRLVDAVEPSIRDYIPIYNKLLKWDDYIY